jgi:hypothetical protein
MSDDLKTIVADAGAGLGKLPPNPYHEDDSDDEQAALVDRAYDVLGMAEELFHLAMDRKTMHETPKL